MPRCGRSSSKRIKSGWPDGWTIAAWVASLLLSFLVGFLLESLHKPIIRDLISLYDDLATIHRQMQEAVADAARLPEEGTSKVLDRLKTMDTNIAHNCEFIVEVLARLEVTMLPLGTGKVDKQTQRAVAVEIAEDPDEDGNVVRVVKRGFYWKDRVLRAEASVVPNAIAAFLLYLRDETGKIPHAYFHWGSKNPVAYLFDYVVFGQGDTAPVTREVLRQAEPNEDNRPSIHVGGY